MVSIKDANEAMFFRSLIRGNTWLGKTEDPGSNSTLWDNGESFNFSQIVPQLEICTTKSCGIYFNVYKDRWGTYDTKESLHMACQKYANKPTIMEIIDESNKSIEKICENLHNLTKSLTTIELRLEQNEFEQSISDFKMTQQVLYQTSLKGDILLGFILVVVSIIFLYFLFNKFWYFRRLKRMDKICLEEY